MSKLRDLLPPLLFWCPAHIWSERAAYLDWSVNTSCDERRGHHERGPHSEHQRFAYVPRNQHIPAWCLRRQVLSSFIPLQRRCVGPRDHSRIAAQPALCLCLAKLLRFRFALMRPREASPAGSNRCEYHSRAHDDCNRSSFRWHSCTSNFNRSQSSLFEKY